MLLQIKNAKDKAQYNKKQEEENQDLQKKLLENIKENNHLKKRKQDLIDHIWKPKYDEKVQDEMLRNLKNDKYSLEKESNTNIVLVTIQKEVNLVKKQTTRNPYRHPNYKSQFNQQQGQNEHKQRIFYFGYEKTQNLQPKQKMERFIQ